MTHHSTWELPIGATPDAGGTRFRVWAADARSVAVALLEGDRVAATHVLAPEGDGYFGGHVPGVRPGARYAYQVDGGDPRPDPASRSQPDGVHGPSAVVDPAAFRWTDGGWRGLPLEELVIYELHVGAVTPDGTFDGLIARLDDLKRLGVTAIELMPVADFPGRRGWGYDGVSLFAPARAYGGPEGLRRLVDAAHARGLAVLLDVVYNHLGPDGNYLQQFSRAYFTGRHITPWGDALNFDGPDSRPVRDFFVANACCWAHEYHLDGLRLDATHAILDDSPTHILAELADRVRASLPPDRRFLVIAEHDGNDPRLVRRRADGGYGLDGVWADDFHHEVRATAAGDRDGYFASYRGAARDIAATIRQGWLHVGQYLPALKRARGAPADDVPYPRFVYCIQNHDQIGNRALGDRLSHAIAPAAYRAVSALLLLCPETPLLFMGQEWAASSPFQYFTDHNPELGRLVTEGRRREFAGFVAFGGASIPDPQALDTFLRSKLRWEEREEGVHAGVLRLYRELLALRREHPALVERGRDSVAVAAIGERTIALRRTAATGEDLLAVVHLGGGAAELSFDDDLTRPPTGHGWAPIFDSEDSRFGGEGGPAPVGAALALREPRALIFELARRG